MGFLDDKENVIINTLIFSCVLGIYPVVQKHWQTNFFYGKMWLFFMFQGEMIGKEYESNRIWLNQRLNSQGLDSGVKTFEDASERIERGELL